jgi:hypothetical protein
MKQIDVIQDGLRAQNRAILAAALNSPEGRALTDAQREHLIYQQMDFDRVFARRMAPAKRHPLIAKVRGILGLTP